MKKQDVLKYFGGTTKTANALGVSKSTVSLWKETIPWKYALLIEKITNGSLLASIPTNPVLN
ncbi:Cro/CI family transcriptional regulator [Providencia hangzhouensis]|uniref:Cro/CI family transcriptional regulator n=1 Tax=Moellerella wisconsensis TaxID=158849 RepID=A0ACD3YBW1_9GAMM|nr:MULTISPECIES: Cro/CI family transcriptional regulator [Morganellaceae]AVL75541.1 hypothetical protein CEQ08_18255 [Providencia rettgeri]ELR5288108.1 helix-turn-helix domain-containing protein [Providencia rettgeri]MBQ0456027.1 helix-turn-helix domain-containing protein [Providencia stuartii]MBS0918359.1 helix-turn-helix domain-containing protein [Providencia rettgeri]QIB29844.1 hypothetical protein G3A48_08895 [Providencia stuartii]